MLIECRLRPISTPVSDEPSFHPKLCSSHMPLSSFVALQSSPAGHSAAETPWSHPFLADNSPRMEHQLEVQTEGVVRGEDLSGRMGAGEEVRVWWDAGE